METRNAAPIVPTLERGKNGQLLFAQAVADGAFELIPIRAVESFPWSHPRRFVSLRDEKGNEVWSIEDLDALTAAGGAGTEASRLVEEDLAERMWAPHIQRILSLRERYESWHWIVETDYGPRSFLTAKGEEPRMMPNGIVLIKDKGCDFFLIERPDDLDPKSKVFLSRLVDIDMKG